VHNLRYHCDISIEVTIHEVTWSESVVVTLYVLCTQNQPPSNLRTVRTVREVIVIVIVIVIVK